MELGAELLQSKIRHISDNGATASWLYENIDAIYKELKMIIFARSNVDITELLAFNKHILDLYHKKTM